MNILVLGVAFTDIKGFPQGKYDPIGTNKGSVTVTHGGVARNVAEDLANLGANVELMITLDDNSLGGEIRSRLEGAGVSLKNSLTVREDGIGIWLAVFDENGDLAGSVSKMPDISPLEKAFCERGDELVKNADAVVVEFDTSEAIAEKAAELCLKHDKPLYVIVGNMSVILSRPELMSACKCVIMNEIEAGKLLGTKLVGRTPGDVITMLWASGKALKLKSIIVTLGEMGCVYADFASGECGCVPSVRCHVKDTTGAGDAFFSASVICLSRGEGLKSACAKGARLASSVIGSTLSVCAGDCRSIIE